MKANIRESAGVINLDKLVLTLHANDHLLRLVNGHCFGFVALGNSWWSDFAASSSRGEACFTLDWKKGNTAFATRSFKFGRLLCFAFFAYQTGRNLHFIFIYFSIPLFFFFLFFSSKLKIVWLKFPNVLNLHSSVSRFLK